MKQLNKYLILTIAISWTILLSGCLGNPNQSGSTNPKTIADERNKVYENSEFYIKFPKEWELIEQKDFLSSVPANTIAVVRNNIKNDNFVSNVNIIKNPLQTPKSSSEYAKEIINKQSSSLINYKEISRETLKIQIGNSEYDTIYINFEGRQTASEDPIKYSQIFATTANSAFIALGATSTKDDPNTAKIIENIVKSLVIK